MFDFVLALKLTAQTFSLKKDSLRYPTAKRVLSAFIVLPFFLILIIINNFFMLLDWIFFPGFRKMKLNKTAFIVGVPRSATTYLFHILAKDTEHFTCCKLWEIILAPSVIQKYIFRAIIKANTFIGRPLYHSSLWADKILFSKISRLHQFSFSDPEEDEMFLLYAFSSMYLTFFFPGVAALDEHLFFDDEISSTKRKRIMLFYKRCVQRHAYVFDRKERKVYLSKNPCFISKVVTIAETFPEAKLIYMLRSPLKTIPSTISLNANIYAVFNGTINKNPLSEKTTAVIIRWYNSMDIILKKYWNNRSLIVPFKNITSQPEITVHKIYRFLNLIPCAAMQSLLKTEQQIAANYKSNHQYNEKDNIFKNEISSQLDFILNGDYKDKI
jgi:hypothetical protein